LYPMASIHISGGTELECTVLASACVFAGTGLTGSPSKGGLSITLPTSPTTFKTLPSALCYLSTLAPPPGASQPLILEWCAWASRVAGGGGVDLGTAATQLAQGLSGAGGGGKLAGGSAPSVADVACAALFSLPTSPPPAQLPPALVAWLESVAGPGAGRAPWWGAAPTPGAAPAPAAAPGGKKRGAGGDEGEGSGGVAKKGGAGSSSSAGAPGGAASGGGSGGASAADVLALATYTTTAPIDATSTPLMSQPILDNLVLLLNAAIAAAFPAYYPTLLADLAADVAPNLNPKFVHHYQFNSAMTIFARLKKGGAGVVAAAGAAGSPPPPPLPTSPVAVAQAVLAALTAAGPHTLIGKVEVSGPGYVNIYLPHNYVTARLSSLLLTGAHGCLPASEPTPRRVIIDYSSPNIAKDMHIGHLRSTIIGDALARLLEFCGHAVERVNHVGDWGTQFGMLIAHVKDLLGCGLVSEDTLYASVGNLTKYYREAKKRFDGEGVPGFPGDPTFKARAHGEVVALQGGDAANLALWSRMVEVSAAMFQGIYASLGIDPRLTLCGESFYNPLIPGVIGELEAGGLLEDSEGARIMRVPGQEVPLMVRKGDGGYGYDSTDLAALKYRLQERKGDWLIYVVDSGQALHFELVFAGGVKAGWWPGAGAGASSNAPRVVHAGFGVMQGEDRKKFKTRDGSTVRLEDVLNEARERALAVLLERGAGKGSSGSGSGGSGGGEGTSAPTFPPSALANATPEEIHRTACVLGYGGVKYFDLRQNRLSDYIFSYDRMLSPDGDTAVYLQYAQARLSSILRKAREAAGGVDIEVALKAATPLGDPAAQGVAWVFQHPTEVLLAAELLRFSDVLVGIQRDLMPHRLCEYMYGLAGKVTDFYRDCNILGGATPTNVRDSRLRIVCATHTVLVTCMRLLGLEPLERI
jgi:arginyl-tRNA synthetase